MTHSRPIGSLCSMPHIKIPGVKAYVSNGKVYAYHRATGKRLKSLYGSPEFFAEVEALQKLQIKPEPSRGTWGALVAGYRASPKFQEDIQPRTRKDYQKVLDWLKPLDPTPVTNWSRKFVMRLRAKAQKEKGRRFANYVQAVVSIVFSWGLDYVDGIEQNPASDIRPIRRPKDAPRTNRPWKNGEWDVVTAAAPPHLLAPIMLCGVLGWREGEAITRRRRDYDAKTQSISRISTKGYKEVSTKIPRKVTDALEAILPHNATTLLVNSRGLPWTQDGFRASFFKFIRALETAGKVGPGLTVHGLRHTCATRLREMGYDLRTIADMLGQKTEGMAGYYAEEADLRDKLDKVVDRIDRNATGTEIV